MSFLLDAFRPLLSTINSHSSTELEARFRELQLKVAATEESAKAEGFFTGHMAGREQYLASEDHKHQLEIARDQGRDQYLASMITKSFYQMLDYKLTSQKVVGLRRGYRYQLAGPLCGCNLAAFPKEPPLNHEDEFGVLVEERKKMNEDEVDE
ncbi:UNVERIFIED_CONTAM: hypothetical protein Sindi_1261800 [Sesamum indicum]